MRQVNEGLRKELHFRPNDVGLHAYIENPYDKNGHVLELLGGASMEVTSGRGTLFDKLSNDGPTIYGRIVTTDGKPVNVGTALITVTQDPSTPEKFHTVSAPLDAEGGFSVGAHDDVDWKLVKGEYLPQHGFAPCSVDWQERR
jgi:hypothetical protein